MRDGHSRVLESGRCGKWPKGRALGMRLMRSEAYAVKDYPIVSVVPDNLVKGAAGQAVQNMNLMLQIDERTGFVFSGSNP